MLDIQVDQLNNGSVAHESTVISSRLGESDLIGDISDQVSNILSGNSAPIITIRTQLSEDNLNSHFFQPSKNNERFTEIQRESEIRAGNLIAHSSIQGADWNKPLYWTFSGLNGSPSNEQILEYFSQDLGVELSSVINLSSMIYSGTSLIVNGTNLGGLFIDQYINNNPEVYLEWQKKVYENTEGDFIFLDSDSAEDENYILRINGNINGKYYSIESIIGENEEEAYRLYQEAGGEKVFQDLLFKKAYLNDILQGGFFRGASINNNDIATILDSINFVYAPKDIPSIISQLDSGAYPEVSEAIEQFMIDRILAASNFNVDYIYDDREVTLEKILEGMYNSMIIDSPGLHGLFHGISDLNRSHMVKLFMKHREGMLIKTQEEKIRHLADMRGMREEEKIAYLILKGSIMSEFYNYSRLKGNGSYKEGSISIGETIEAFNKIQLLRDLPSRVLLNLEGSYQHRELHQKLENGESSFLLLNGLGYFQMLSDIMGVDVGDIEKEYIKSIQNQQEESHYKHMLTFTEHVIVNYTGAIGICGDIHTYLAWEAYNLGLKDSFSSHSNSGGIGHIVSGFRNQEGNIVFQDYSTIYESHSTSLDYAMEEFEQTWLNGTSMFYYRSMGKDYGKNLGMYQTKSGKILEQMTHGGNSLSQIGTKITTLDTKDQSGVNVDIQNDQARYEFDSGVGLQLNYTSGLVDATLGSYEALGLRYDILTNNGFLFRSGLTDIEAKLITEKHQKAYLFHLGIGKILKYQRESGNKMQIHFTGEMLGEKVRNSVSDFSGNVSGILETEVGLQYRFVSGFGYGIYYGFNGTSKQMGYRYDASQKWYKSMYEELVNPENIDISHNRFGMNTGYYSENTNLTFSTRVNELRAERKYSLDGEYKMSEKLKFRGNITSTKGDGLMTGDRISSHLLFDYNLNDNFSFGVEYENEDDGGDDEQLKFHLNIRN